MSTPYHAKYLAHELTKRLPAEKAEKLSQSLANATVDLNPHQIEAALFAFRSPLSRGAILADEVGLGKTIEAGLIVSQLWAERKRRILCIVPASLRKQWNRELAEKFYIDSVILETKAYNQAKKAGVASPFVADNKVVIVLVPVCQCEGGRTPAHRLGPDRHRRSPPRSQRLQKGIQDRSQPPGFGRRPAEGLAHGDAAAELSDGTVRLGQLHRPAHLRQ